MSIPSEGKKFIPQEVQDKKRNNYLYFKYPYLMLWREDDGAWFPLPSDIMTEEEIASLGHFVNNKYLLMNTERLSLSELAEDLGVYLKGVISKDNIKRMQKFIVAAKF